MSGTTATTKLIYDSARSTAEVGMRAVITAGRSLVFRGENLTVDVVVHAGQDAWGYHYGQVIRHSDGSPVSGVDVVLDDGDAVQTDECGQFAVASPNARAAKALHVDPGGDRQTFVLPA